MGDFRQQTRAWLEANCPAGMRAAPASDESVCWGGRNWTFESGDQKDWLDRMIAKGWTVPDWPVEYGGAGLGPDDLGRVVDRQWDPPVTMGVRLVSVADDSLQHVGQAAYLRGMSGR